MPTRILFIHPMGMDMYNELTLDLLVPPRRRAPRARCATSQAYRRLPPFRDPRCGNTTLARWCGCRTGRTRRGGLGLHVGSARREAKPLVGIPVTGPFEALARTALALGRLTIIAGGYKIDTWASRAAAPDISLDEPSDR